MMTTAWIRLDCDLCGTSFLRRRCEANRSRGKKFCSWKCQKAYWGTLVNSGVYAIIHSASGRHYVGSSVHIRLRWGSHRHELKRGSHANPHLQRAWNFYGKDAFSFVLLEEVRNPSKLRDKEQEWINRLHAADTTQGFNIAPFAESRRGMKHRAEVRAYISKVQTGRKHTPETIERMKRARTGSGNCCSKLRESDVLEIKTLLAKGNLQKDIAFRFQVSRSTITEINRGTNWRHVSPELRLTL